jgi:D-alanyl-D-alanine carboxypeptidase
LLGLAAGATAITICSDAADARHHHRYHIHYAHAGHLHHRHSHVAEYSPPYASIVVDGNSGSVLQQSNPDAPRHPASLTKVMTLYLLFERLDAGRIKLDSQLKVSEHASEQSPTKLGLKPGQTISVEDAIKGIVTKSANDAAVTIAENLGGDEDRFAQMMTQKAHALGMSRTTYVNASGLPDDDQITTARDQALLGRAIQDRFPRYYKYFSTDHFVYHGEAMRNHNHLLGSVDGVDGIKTGFTRASGFNLLTSVHRDGRFIIGVVMGGPSSSERDDRMRDLIHDHIREASLHRTAPVIAEGALPQERAQEKQERPQVVAQQVVAQAMPQPAVQAIAAVKPAVAAHADPAPTATVAAAKPAAGNPNDPIRPFLVRTVTYRTAPVQTASLAPMPSLVPVAVQPVPQPAPVATATLPAPSPVPAATPAPVQAVQAAPQPVMTPITRATADNRGAAADADSAAEPTPAPVQTRAALAQPVQAQLVQAPRAGHAEIADAAPDRAEPATIAPKIRAHGGWLIQIGAFDDEDQAKQHLSAAQQKVRTALAAADPFTERVQKGDKALFRARFAGFDKTAAESACKALKRSDFECMALKD